MSLSEQFLPAYLEEVVGDRFGRYSKYIIQDRAIPDVRDGLKPVQRRILYAMYDSGNTPDKPYRKSAKTVGDVMGNYHPHGDSSIYEGMVRMAQPWKMGHVLVDGHGNWGSQDDDPAAAMRYTEARLSSIAMELLRDIEKRTVLFKDNFDNTAKEPVVLPSRYPNLLVNGASGISAGFATEIPPHNLREVIDACIAVMQKPEIELAEIMTFIKGPDFPTSGIIMGGEGILDAYRTGKGRVYLRSKTDIESLRGGKQQIVITEIPYQVVKSRLVTAMENIRLEKKVEGIAEVRDESGREGLRIVVELKKDADANGILAYLLKKTDLQITYNFNMVAIVNKTPQQLGLKAMLTAYIEHQREVVTNRTQFELEKAEDRAHVLEGLVKALNILDEVIAAIKASKNRQDAQNNLQWMFGFTERQADSILTLQLYRLTNLEIHSLQKELDELTKKIEGLRAILDSDKKLIAVIRKELLEIREKYGIERRSVIQEEVEEIKVNLEVLVNAEDVLVTLSNEGYIKRTSMLSFTRSGGELGSSGVKDGDYITRLFEVNTLENLLIFTSRGQYFLLPVHQIPEYKWKDAGTAIVNVIQVPKEDNIVSVIPVSNFEDPGKSLVFVSRKGQVKRTELKDYATKRAGAVAAAKVAADDSIIQVVMSDGHKDIVLISKEGMSIRFNEQEVNAMGRVSGGVRGIQLRDGDEVVAALWVENDEGEILTITDLGYGKRSLLLDYQAQSRGGKGMATFEFKEGKRVKPNGSAIAGAFYCREPLQIMAYSEDGQAYPIHTEQVPIAERKSIGKLLADVGKKGQIVDLVNLPITETGKES
ncbi:DNA topoisomerase IV, A subunit [Paenibacillus vortex V453]|jgi:topoisomerase-4 subunit A|uniref:DNA topoisomerase (ATP-hydrolyzing) n=2 Tax=Paenibacillus TaxID=44249 RepID=A0A163LKC4_9BACL|nr:MULTISPECIES: DNA gyrase subunit A [Paenibacillus]ANA82118.1 DNA gyrase subunit A [Paenibacillus glucanolyticus]AVV59144.1 DNA gyrase subunit A [Paenibacillus glucanolyticus]EFU41479.1 DNA topoisomerase IV, A subunit [Paenibacillus vortex V453]ETT43564.1 DNA topoisomerase IV subunit A [Paenibacillus sp. FSL R5-808]KZS48202.1 DNA gyrase subunit A [Paenibacillus glucanolyticus]